MLSIVTTDNENAATDDVRYSERERLRGTERAGEIVDRERGMGIVIDRDRERF